MVVTLLAFVDEMTGALDLDADFFDTSAPAVPGPSLQGKVKKIHRVFDKCLAGMQPPKEFVKRASTVLVSCAAITLDSYVDVSGRYICTGVDSTGRPLYRNSRTGSRLEYSKEGSWRLLSPEGSTCFFIAHSTGNEAPRTGWSAVGDDRVEEGPFSQLVLSRFRYANGFNALLDDGLPAIDKVRLFNDEKAALEVELARLKIIASSCEIGKVEGANRRLMGEQKVVVTSANPAFTVTTLHTTTESAAEDKVAKPIKIRCKKARLKQSSAGGKRSNKSKRRPSRQHVEIREAVASSGCKLAGSSTEEIRALAEAMMSCSKGQQNIIVKEAAARDVETLMENSLTDVYTDLDLSPEIKSSEPSNTSNSTYQDAAREAAVAEVLSDLVAEVIASECSYRGFPENMRPTDSPRSTLSEFEDEPKDAGTSTGTEYQLETAFAEASEVTPLVASANGRPQPFRFTSQAQDKLSAWDEIDAGAPVDDRNQGGDSPRPNEQVSEVDETILELVREYARIDDACSEHAKGIASAIKEVTAGYVCGPLLDDLLIEPQPCWNVKESSITGYRVFEDENGRDSHVRYIIHSRFERVEARSAADTSLAWRTTDSDDDGRTKTYLVHRRYRDFQELVQQLQAKTLGVQLPPLPKTGFTRRFGSEYLDKKRAGLEDFLTNLLRVESSPSWTAGTMAQDALVLDFLRRPSPEYASFLTDDACKSLAPRPNLSEGKSSSSVSLMRVSRLVC